MSYGYIRTEGPDGLDYSFYSPKTGRIYNVSFEMSLYVGYAESFPTLVKHGYGFLFKFQKTRDFDKEDGITNIDNSVKETISEIIEDFLLAEPNTCFLVYECHDYKNSKFFANWYDEFNIESKMKKDGITLSVDDKPYNDIHFGFITTAKNSLFDIAQQELQDFAVSFML
jgi:hypothetical protein